jgi:hypothetical protein
MARLSATDRANSAGIASDCALLFIRRTTDNRQASSSRGIGEPSATRFDLKPFELDRACPNGDVGFREPERASWASLGSACPQLHFGPFWPGA